MVQIEIHFHPKPVHHTAENLVLQQLTSFLNQSLVWDYKMKCFQIKRLNWKIDLSVQT